MGDPRYVQEQYYWFPYHYASSYPKFSQCFNDTWGINYVATIEFLLTILRKDNFDSLIDIGCGDGRLTREIHLNFPNKKVIGIDNSVKAINLAKAMNQDIEIEFKQIDITHGSINDKYDRAILMEVFEHIDPVEAKIFLNATKSLLIPGGILYITVPHTNKEIDPSHYRHFTIETLTKCVTPYFHLCEIIPFERISFKKNLIDLILTNKYFILNNEYLKNKLYNYYKKHLFFSMDEALSKRIFMKLERRD